MEDAAGEAPAGDGVEADEDIGTRKRRRKSVTPPGPGMFSFLFFLIMEARRSERLGSETRTENKGKKQRRMGET
jgi:hypothetical protein